MAYVFICYFHENRQEIQPVLDELSRNEIEYWIYERDQELGAKWRPETAEKIRGANAFIFFMSKQYSRTESNVHKEIDIAKEYINSTSLPGRWICPIILDDSDIPDIDLGNGENLRDIHAINIKGGNIDSIFACVSAIKRIIDDEDINYGIINIRSYNLSKAPAVVCFNGCFYVENEGVWKIIDENISYYDQSRTAKSLGGNDIINVRTKPGKCTIKLMYFYQANVRVYSAVDPYYDHKDSNEIFFEVLAKQILTVSVIDTPSSGFWFWREKKIPQDIYIEVS